MLPCPVFLSPVSRVVVGNSARVLILRVLAKALTKLALGGACHGQYPLYTALRFTWGNPRLLKGSTG